MQKVRFFLKPAGLVRLLAMVVFCGVALLLPGMALQASAQDFTISGTITDEASLPIENIRVTIKRFLGYDLSERPIWTDVISGTTSASGGYSLTVPDAGPYRLEFVDAVTPHRYHGEYYDDGLTLNTSTDVSIPEGQSNVVANAQLTSIQPITGHVTDEAGNPLAGIRVSTFYLAGNPQLEHRFWAQATNTTTDATGAYTLTTPDIAPFRIGFFDLSPSPRYQTEYYENSISAWQASDILFDKDHPIQVIDAQLAIASVITGRVVYTDGTPVAQAGVFAGIPVADEGGQVFLQQSSDTSTDSNGYYTLTLPLSGTVGVGVFDQIYPNRFSWQYYENVKIPQQPTSVTVTLGSVTPDINFQVQPFGIISGRLTDKQGNPISNTVVSWHQLMTDTFGNEIWQHLGQIEVTDADGRYELPVWDELTTHICFKLLYYPSQNDSFAPRCYGTTSGDPASGADVSVAAGEVITGIDVQLSRYARVTGTVTGNDGQPLQNVVINSIHIVTDTNDAPLVVGSDLFVRTDSNGHYELMVPEQFDFGVAANPLEQSHYTMEYYENQFDPFSSHFFTYELDSLINIDFQLVLKGDITGTVTTPDHQPLAGVAVTAFHYFWDGMGGKSWIPYASATTDDSGAYTFSQVLPDTYRIGFGQGQDYVAEFYSHTTTLEAATDIVLGLGESAGNIDGTLAPLYRTISGQVTDPSGNPLSGISVRLGHNDTGNWVFDGYATSSDLSGTYTLTALPNGNFSIGFFDESGTYVAEYYDNHYAATDALTFTIPSSAPITNINAQMKGKALIQGKLSGPDGEAVANHSITLYDVGLNEIAQTQTISDGSYALNVLGGVYRLCAGTATQVTTYEAECYLDANPSDIAAATPFTVENGVEFTLDLQLAKKAVPTGTVAILLDSMPKSIRNLHFNSSVGTFALDDPAIDDGDAYSNAITFTLPSAVYSFTLGLPNDRYLRSLSCEGTDAQVDGASVQLSLVAATTVTCTFRVTTGATVRTFSYHDANGDGMYNEGEAPQAGITTTLHINASGVISEQVSDANGMTEFSNLPPGSEIFVCVTPQSAWANSQPGTLDSQFNSPCYGSILAGGQLATVRFGNIEANDPDFKNQPSTATDGLVVVDAPLVDDWDEEKPATDITVTLYLPLVSR